MPASTTLQRILIGDDQPHVLTALHLLLKPAGYQVECVDSATALVAAAQSRPFDLILMDMNYVRDTTSGQEGLDLLGQLQSAAVHRPPIVVMTGWSTVDLAVAALQRGAADFIQKPWDNARLLAVLQQQMERAAARRQEEQQAHHEIDLARSVQERLLPPREGNLATLSYAAACVPACEVGGDFFDVIELSPGRTALLLADVSGKGTAAALLMANLGGLIRGQLSLAADPSDLLRAVNRLLYQSTRPEHYATLFFGLHDARTQTLWYVNCGHPAPVLRRQDGTLEQLAATHTVLGLFPDGAFASATIPFRQQDILVAVSDGLLEAEISPGIEWGEAGLISAIQCWPGGQLPSLVDHLLTDSGRSSTADDRTVLAVRPNL